MLEGRMRQFLRAEGAALFAASVIAFHALDISWWMFLVLFLTPDLTLVFFLFGPRIGAIAYNIMHSTIGPILLGALAWWIGFNIMGTLLAGCAVIWMAHVGLDRMLGLGLKHFSSFRDTHLGKIGREKG